MRARSARHERGERPASGSSRTYRPSGPKRFMAMARKPSPWLISWRETSPYHSSAPRFSISVATLNMDSARRKKPVLGRRTPRRRVRRSASGDVESSRVAKLKFVDPPSGLNPAATAIPSTSVDLPLPFCPTMNVTPGSSARSSSARTAGSDQGHVCGSEISSRRRRTDRMSGSRDEVAFMRQARAPTAPCGQVLGCSAC